jgi:hypothetical protein
MANLYSPIIERLVKSSDVVITDSEEYTTNGESIVITKKPTKIILDNTKQNHIVIKSLTDTKIVPKEGLIDEEYNELNIGKGACVEFFFGFTNWYILSSDGVKLD